MRTNRTAGLVVYTVRAFRLCRTFHRCDWRKGWNSIMFPQVGQWSYSYFILLGIVILVGFGLSVGRCECNPGQEVLEVMHWNTTTLSVPGAGVCSCYPRCSETYYRQSFFVLHLLFAAGEGNVFIRWLYIQMCWLGNLSCCINNCRSIWAPQRMAHAGSCILGQDLCYIL